MRPARPPCQRPTSLRLSGRALAAALAIVGASVLAPAEGRADRAATPLRAVDEARLGEFLRISGALGDSIWPGYSAPSRQLLLVSGEGEYLLWPARTPAGFDEAGRSESLNSVVYRRDRTFPTRFLATFPAVGGVSTIVVGPAESTDVKRSTPWILTLLHEALHQYQYAAPDYQERVTALDLAGGDSTGMWMLQYPFPYEEKSVQQAFDRAGRALAAALDSNEPGRAAAADAYLEARDRLRRGLAPADLRYLDFQLWQEGVARYAEIAFARRAGALSVPGEPAAGLADFTPYADEAARIEARVRERLRGASLGEEKRVAFYAMGAGEALLLDRIAPGWRSDYRDGPLSLDRFFRRAPR